MTIHDFERSLSLTQNCCCTTLLWPPPLCARSRFQAMDWRWLQGPHEGWLWIKSFIAASYYFRSIYLQYRDTYHAMLCAHFVHFWSFVTLLDGMPLRKMIYPSYKMLLCGSMSTVRSSSQLVSDLIFYCHDNTLRSITTGLFGNLGHQMVSVHQLQGWNTLGLSKNPGADPIAMRPLAKCWLQISDSINWRLPVPALQIRGCWMEHASPKYSGPLVSYRLVIYYYF